MPMCRVPNAKMPKLTEILRGYGEASKMAQARLLLLRMQKRFSSLQFDTICNAEKAGDVVESTGGILSPWKASAGVVLRHLAKMFSLSQDDVLETRRGYGCICSPSQNLLRTLFSDRAERGRPSANDLRYHSRTGSACNPAL